MKNNYNTEIDSEFLKLVRSSSSIGEWYLELFKFEKKNGIHLKEA
jgi:hypothetical protein